MIKQLDSWHKTKTGWFVFAIVELAISYGFVSLSIDRGNFLWYVLTLIFLVGTLQNIVHLIGAFAHHGKR